jgi:transcriptional regulator with GAF, ATPase, and Fis domain
MSVSGDGDPFLQHFLPGNTPGMRRMRDNIALVNRRYKNPPRMGRSVLLVGESGVGKNHVARTIAAHLYWLRDPGLWNPAGIKPRSLLQISAEHFAEVSLPNLPTELIESELFGHVKGAFTGATADKEGYFGADHIQDLLLDEIGEASPVLQTKLLQVLNDRSYKPVGAAPGASQLTEARIFLATNRDLAAQVRLGQFRKDLYWRIQHIVIQIPPLREQAERIPVLAESIVMDIRRAHGVTGGNFRLQSTDLEWAKRQPWPGNVRELERLLWRWVYEEGTRPLHEIQKEYPQEAFSHGSETLAIKTLIRSRIADALDRGAALSPSVGEFTRQLELDAQRCLYELKNELPLDRKALRALFDDGDRAAKQISAWGEKVRSS